MRPVLVINGILLGSSLSIALSLFFVLVVFLIIGDDYPRIERELSPLVSSLLIFIVMTILSAGSFYAVLIGHRWRRWLQAFLCAGLLATGWYYWPY